MHKLSKKEERIGKTMISNQGYLMKCIDYKDNNNIVVEFENGYTTSSSWYNFIKGGIKNPFHRGLVGVGYMGFGSYTSKDEGGKYFKTYQVWKNMILRCYDEVAKKKNPSYDGCSVSEEWHNYQSFCKWYHENSYESMGNLELDKDILNKGNKLYSSETCILVPSRVNKCFINRASRRGDLPIGVHKRNDTGKLAAQIMLDGKKKKLGSFDTPEEAFQAYKEAKEQYIKKIALEYKYKIPNRLFVALMNYKVEMTD